MPSPSTLGVNMIQFVPVDFVVLPDGTRLFNSMFPQCPCGCPRVWKHGLVLRVLDEGPPCLVQRYRCPQCRRVFQDKPRSHWPWQRAAVGVLLTTLLVRIRRHRWPKGIPRQRGGHWLRRLGVIARDRFPGQGFLDVIRIPWRCRDPVTWLTGRARKRVSFLPT